MNELINDKNCTWINDLKPRTNIKILSKNENCDWLIIGAGYTGLSTARKLGELCPNQKKLSLIVLMRRFPPHQLSYDSTSLNFWIVVLRTLSIKAFGII